MTVADQTTYIVVTPALGVPIPFDRKVYSATDVRVRYGAVGTPATAGVDYTIEVEPDFSGATITPLAGLIALADGEPVVIERELAYTQEAPFAGSTTVPTEKLEKTLDRMVCMIQQLRTKVASALSNVTGTLTLDLGGRRFTNSGAPVADADLATKAYADGVLADAVLGVIPDGSITDAKLASGLTSAKFAANSFDRSKLIEDGLLLQRDAAQAYATATGTSDAIVATIGATLTAYVTGLRVRIKHTAANTTTTPTLNVNGRGAKTITKGAGSALVAGDIVGANFIGEYLFDATLDKWVMLNPASGLVVAVSIPSISDRQVVAAGPQDSNGAPTLLPASASGLTLTTQNLTSTALVVHAAQGYALAGEQNRVGRRATNFSWTLTNSATNYLFVEVAADGTLTAVATTVAPVITWAGTPAVTSGLYTFVVSTMTMYKGDGSAANPVYAVAIGEAICSGGNITSATAYRYGRKFKSPAAAAQAATTATTVTHNFGVPAEYLKGAVKLRCTTAHGSFEVGDVIDGYTFRNLTYFILSQPLVMRRMTAHVVTNGNSWGTMPAAWPANSNAALNTANFEQYVEIERAY